MNERIWHQHFLKSNHINAEVISPPIRQKMQVFARWQRLLAKASETETASLLQRIRKLDGEIHHDLLLEFEDLLEDEGLQPQEKPRGRLSANEQVLADLLALGKSIVSIPELRSRGYGGALGPNLIAVGPHYRLRRAHQYARYQIHPIHD